MQIDDGTFRVQPENPVLRIRAAQTPSRVDGMGSHRAMNDTARTTVLARLASEALRPMQEEAAIRPDKVAQFKGLAADDAPFSADDAIDAIFSRMFP